MLLFKITQQFHYVISVKSVVRKLYERLIFASNGVHRTFMFTSVFIIWELLDYVLLALNGTGFGI